MPSALDASRTDLAAGDDHGSWPRFVARPRDWSLASYTPLRMHAAATGVGVRGGVAQRLALAPVALVAADLVVVGATFAPWLRSGSRMRSSYEVAAALDRLQVLEGWVRPAVTVLWYFVPLLAALSVLAIAAGHVRAGALGSLALAAASAAFALSLRQAGAANEWGVPLALAAAAAVVLLAIVTIRGERHPTMPTTMTSPVETTIHTNGGRNIP